MTGFVRQQNEMIKSMVNLKLIARTSYDTLEIGVSAYNHLSEYHPANKRMFTVEARYTF
jgi:hypothetical protein